MKPEKSLDNQRDSLLQRNEIKEVNKEKKKIEKKGEFRYKKVIWEYRIVRIILPIIGGMVIAGITAAIMKYAS